MINEENKSIYEQLIEPFRSEEISWRVSNSFNEDKNAKTAKALVVPYLKKEVIQDRLDKVFGLEGWSNTYRKWGEDAQLCGISFKVGNEVITKWDGAPNSNIDDVKVRVKGGLSDSFKRAAKMIGIGRYLSKFSPTFLDVELKGNKLTPTIKPIDFSTTLEKKYNQEIKKIFNISPDSPLMITKESINTILLLLNQKNVNIQSVLNRYSVKSIEYLTEEEALKTINILVKQEISA